MGLVYEPRLYPLRKKGDWGWGGRADLLAEVEWGRPEIEDGLALLDWKSGKKPTAKKGYAEWPLQVAGYRQAVYDSKDLECKVNAVIHLDKFNTVFTIYDYSDTYEQDIEGFIHLAKFWHNRNPKHLEKGLPSCTTITGSLDKPALKQWAANLTSEYVIKEGIEYIDTHHALGPDSLRNIATQAKKNYMKMSEKAMSIGTEVHKYIEDFLKSGTLPKTKFMNTQARAAWEAWLQWFETVNLKVIELETRVYGRFDSQRRLAA